MALLVQRLLRRRSPITCLASLINQNSQLQTLTPASFSQSIDSRLKSLLPSPPPKADFEKTEVRYDFIYPSFSYGLTVNPVFQKVVTEEEEEEEVVEEGENGLEEMRMDSTKKKRKKKMNKHKYKKLMKRTRHTT